MQKAILFLIINFNFLLSAESINPFYKSVLIPGWGESSLGYKDKSKFFIITETVIGLSCISLHKIAEMKENEYILFAYENANAKKIRNHEYWVDIGNYNSNYDYDAEHLRMRDGEESKWDLQPWEWNRAGNRQKFEKMRIESDKLYFASRFLIGGIILNHIVSGIHSLYLSRNQNDLGLNYSMYPQINYHKNDIFYQLNIDFRI